MKNCPCENVLGPLAYDGRDEKECGERITCSGRSAHSTMCAATVNR